MKYEHKLGWVLDIPAPLKQRHIEAYYKVMREIQEKLEIEDVANISRVEYAGVTARVACKLGWTHTPDGEDISDASPQWVQWVYQKVSAEIGEAITIPPE